MSIKAGTLPFFVTSLLAALPALAFDDGDPRPEPPREPRDYTVSLGPDVKFFPGGELIGEFKMTPRFSFGGLVELGYRTESDIDKATGKQKSYTVQTYGYGIGATAYPVGNFENGVQVGIWLMQIARGATDTKIAEQFAPAGAGNVAQLYAGYKWTHAMGFSLWAQGGGQVGFVRYAEPCGAGSAAGSMCDAEGVKASWAAHAGVGYTF